MSRSIARALAAASCRLLELNFFASAALRPLERSAANGPSILEGNPKIAAFLGV